jgi:hypothetical protein
MLLNMIYAFVKLASGLAWLCGRIAPALKLTKKAEGDTWRLQLSCKFLGGLCALLLISPVQAQPKDVKALPTEDVRSSNASSSKGNVFRAGGDVRLTQPINGNFYAAGGRITIDQPVAGDANLAGGALTLSAPIGGDLRVAGGEIKIESMVGGKFIASGGNITISNGATVAEAATLYGGNVYIEGKMRGPLTVYAQKVIVNAEVARDVELNAEEIELGPRAKLGAALRYPGNAVFKTAEGVVIGGAVTRGEAMNGRRDTHHDREWHGQMMSSGPGWAVIAASVVAVLAGSVLFLYICTRFSLLACRKLWLTPWSALAAGFAVFLGVPMLAVLVCFTLIGIPLGLALLMLYPLALLTGYIVGVFSISQRVQHAIQKEVMVESRARMLGYFALTLVLALAVGSLPVIGSVISLIIMLLGVGACALHFYSRTQRPSAPPAPVAASLAAVN